MCLGTCSGAKPGCVNLISIQGMLAARLGWIDRVVFPQQAVMA